MVTRGCGAQGYFACEFDRECLCQLARCARYLDAAVERQPDRHLLDFD